MHCLSLSTQGGGIWSWSWCAPVARRPVPAPVYAPAPPAASSAPRWPARLLYSAHVYHVSMRYELSGVSPNVKREDPSAFGASSKVATSFIISVL